MDNRPLDVLGRTTPDVVAGFSKLRSAVMDAGPLDTPTAELVLVAALAASGDLESMRTHVRRGLASGLEEAAMKHAIALTLGAATTLNSVVAALRVVEEQVDGAEA